MSERGFNVVDWLIAPVCGLAIACSAEAEPRDQWVIELDSDVPVPELADRLLVQITDVEGRPVCESCQRQFGVGDDDAWPVSFGIASEGAPDRVLVRSRLYRVQDTGSDGLPLPDQGIDHLAELPPAQGVTTLRVELRMDCYGVGASVAEAEACDPTRGELGPISVLTPPDSHVALSVWPLAADAPCDWEVPEEMTCVPGGAFVMGDARAFIVSPELASAPERLVVLSPFALDTEEMTVGAFRQLSREHPELPLPVAAATSKAPAYRFCTFAEDDDAGAQDEMPLNCISRDDALAICRAQGKRLPTEAEWEFAAGNRERETTYPWGDSLADACNRTVHATDVNVLGGGLGPSYCRQKRPPEDRAAGPRAGGDSDDVTLLGLRNLGGNVSEWVADSLVPYADACVETSTPWLVDPVCARAGMPRANRGASWQSLLLGAQSFQRGGTQSGGAIDAVGVRCAQSKGQSLNE